MKKENCDCVDKKIYIYINKKDSWAIVPFRTYVRASISKQRGYSLIFSAEKLVGLSLGGGGWKRRRRSWLFAIDWCVGVEARRSRGGFDRYALRCIIRSFLSYRRMRRKRKKNSTYIFIKSIFVLRWNLRVMGKEKNIDSLHVIDLSV